MWRSPERAGVSQLIWRSGACRLCGRATGDTSLGGDISTGVVAIGILMIIFDIRYAVEAIDKWLGGRSFE
jgi:hypothetical protein